MENLKAETRAGVLVEALPYLQEYNGKIVVVKYGGNAMINEDLKQAVIRDIVLLNLVGVKVVLVHGGGPEIGELLKKTGKESKFIKGLRYTDKETMEAVQMVLCGKLNKNLVTLLKNAGGKGVGISGMDGGLFEAVKLNDPDGTEYGYVGDIVKDKPADRPRYAGKRLHPGSHLRCRGNRRHLQLQHQRGYGGGETGDRAEGEKADHAD